MKTKCLAEFYELLNLAEDWSSGGLRRKHPGFDPSRLRGTPNQDEALAAIAAEIAVCRRCRLCEKRRNTVPGMGVLSPLVLCIGEGPGEDEDRTGKPFVGKAGQYLDKWLEAVGLSRSTNAYIANVVKCRPPENRDPAPDEIKACLPYLEAQIRVIQPRAILLLGRVAAHSILKIERGIGSLRGKSYLYEGSPVVPTYHPSGVLRTPDYRKDVWEDLKRLKTIVFGEDGKNDAGDVSRGDGPGPA